METPETSIDLQRSPSAENDPGPGLAEDTQKEVLQLSRGIVLSQERGRLDDAQEMSQQNTGRTDNATATLYVPLFRGIVQETASLGRDRHRLQRYDEAYRKQEPGDGSDQRHRSQADQQQGSGNGSTERYREAYRQ